MINFLKCDAKAIIKLILDLSYQERNKIAHKVIEVDNNTVYRFTVADNMSGIKIINICDIRSIEELRDTGFEEIERKDIATFK